MTIKPILFSTPMVRAILDGKKSMTRRVIKPQPVQGWSGAIRFIKWLVGLARFGDADSPAVCDRKPRYEPGDILWVRETWAVDECEKCMAGIPALGGECNCQYIYRADWAGYPRWRPSIFMPRAAARIWLRVTDVRVERVRDITTADAITEGFGGHIYPPDWFAELWDSLNAKRGYSWDSNPWVWVISFERCDKPESEAAGD